MDEEADFELGSSLKLRSLVSDTFAAIENAPNLALRNAEESFPDELEFSEDEFEDAPSEAPLLRSLSPKKIVREYEDAYASPRRRELDVSEFESLVKDTDLPSYFRYKISEFVIVKNYVVEVRKQLNVTENIDVLMTVYGMLEGLKRNIEKSHESSSLLDLASLERLQQFLDRISRYVEETTLSNSRASVRRSRRIEYGQSASLLPLALDVEALEVGLKNNRVQFDCLDGRNAVLTFCKLLKEVANRIRTMKPLPPDAASLSRKVEQMQEELSKHVTENTVIGLRRRMEAWKDILMQPCSAEAFTISVIDVHEKVLSLEKALSSGIKEVSQLLVLDMGLAELYSALGREMKEFLLSACSCKVGFISWLKKEAHALAERPLSSAPLKMRLNIVKQAVTILNDICLTYPAPSHFSDLKKSIFELKNFLSHARSHRSDEFLVVRQQALASGGRVLPSMCKSLSRTFGQH